MTTRPSIPPGSHPIEAVNYLIHTPSIELLWRDIYSWLKRKSTGGLIYGGQRFGKSEAINYIMDLLKNQYNEYFIAFTIPAIDLKKATETQFFSQLLKYTNHQLYQNGTSYAKRQRLLNYLILCSQKKFSNKLVVFFIDEAQQLNDSHFQNLVDIQNELRISNVFSSIFLVGQPELKSMVVAFQNSEKMQIVSRFMSRQHEFRGMRNVSDIEHCLNIYDNIAVYPDGSGWTFSRYFAPNAFEQGWRILSDAKIIWKVFSDLRLTHKLPVKDEIPMAFFSTTIETLYLEIANGNNNFTGFTYNNYKDAAIESGYVDGSRFITHPKIII